MIQEAYASGQSAAFVKLSMRREDRQRLAKEHGIVPGEGAWNWALRRSRQGATPQDLGMAPDNVIKKVLSLSGNKIEVGANWGKEHKPVFYMGTENSVDVGGNLRRVIEAFNPISHERQERMLAAYQGADPQARKVFNTIMEDAIKPTRGLNSIHNHPTESFKKMAPVERALLPSLLDSKAKLNHPEELARLKSVLGPEDAADRIHWVNENIRRHELSLRTRYNSEHPILYPSGYVPPEAWGQNAQDGGYFKNQGVGSHHNIVAEPGVGVHTVRPDKTHGGEKLRSVLWNKRPKPDFKSKLSLLGDVLKRRIK